MSSPAITRISATDILVGNLTPAAEATRSLRRFVSQLERGDVPEEEVAQRTREELTKHQAHITTIAICPRRLEVLNKVDDMSREQLLVALRWIVDRSAAALRQAVLNSRRDENVSIG